MLAAQSSQVDGPPYLSYKELRSNGVPVVLSPAGAQRLFWPLDSASLTSISVMSTPRSPGTLEPYVQQDAEVDAAGSGTRHEISHLPLTEPRVSSVEASVYDLDHWEEAWMNWHRGHTEDHAEYVTYSELSDEDRPFPAEMREDGGWESDSDTEFLIRCCGEDRPLRKAVKLVIRPSEGNHHVTVHDYVSG